MSAVERVNKAWDRIDAWYAKNAPDWTLPGGATDAEIDALAAHLKLTFPEEFRVSLKRHNGIPEGQWPKNWLNPVKEIQSEWDSWTELCKKDESMEATEKSDAYQNKFWCEGWVPIDSDGGGNGFVMDLAPGPKGREGQILFFDHESGPDGPRFQDFAGYLEEIANELEKGRYVVNDDFLEENEEDDDEEGEGDEEEDGDEDEDEGDDDEDYEEDEEDEEEEKNKKKKVKK